MLVLKKNKMLCVFLLFTFLFTIVFESTPNVYANNTLLDIKNHWAKDTIQEMVDGGIVRGYPDGTFKPNNSITRAEFMTLTNRVFNFTEEGEIQFGDVPEDTWFTEAIKIAYAAGYIGGYPDGTIKPNNTISRQEAAIIITKIKQMKKNTNYIDIFNDAKDIPSWSKGSVGAVAEAGFMGGYPDGSFKPIEPITRAEALVLLDRVLKEAIWTINKAGTYGPEEGNKKFDGDVYIKADQVILQNVTITGDLTIAEEVGEGEVTLNNVTVEGDSYIRGGGSDSIYINGGDFRNIIIQKAAGKLRIVMIHDRGASVTVAEEAKDTEIIFQGTFDNINVNTGNVKLTMQEETQVNKLQIDDKAEEVKVNTSKETVIDLLDVNTTTNVNNEGRIIKALGTGAKDSEYKINLPENLQPRRSSGSSSSSTVSVSAINITTTPDDVSALNNSASVAVDFSSDISGVTFYYTLDGTTPSTSSPTSSLITVDASDLTGNSDLGGTVTVKVIGVKSGMNNSSVAKKEITFNAASTAAVYNREELTTALDNSDITTITVVPGTYTGDYTVSNTQTINGSNAIIDGNLTIKADNVVINGTPPHSPFQVINGTVSISSGVNNFTADGTNFDNLTIDGGGLNSVRLRNSSIGNMTVNKPNVRVNMRDTASTNVEVGANATGARLEFTLGSSTTKSVNIQAGTTGVQVASREDNPIEVTGDYEPITLHKVEFNVGIYDALVSINGDEELTVWPGEVEFDLEEGTYSYTITKTGYEDVTGSVTVIESDIIESVTLTLKTYTVTFVDWDNSEIATETIEHGSAATAPADPTRDGYKFTGWSPADFTNITSDLTVTAQYVAVDKNALATAIGEAETNRDSVEISTDGSDVLTTDEWVSQVAMDTYEEAIGAAQGVYDDTSASQATVDQAVTDLDTATATFDGEKAAGTLVPVTGVSIDEADQTIGVGANFQFNATVEPGSATNKDVIWSSSDDGIATVSATGEVTGVAVGTAEITVTTNDGGFQDTVTITVTEEADFDGGSGTEEAPYQIATAEHLDNVRKHLGSDHANTHFILLNDIDLGDATSDGGAYWNDGKGWEPIGTEGDTFQGIFNGEGYSVINLFIDRPEVNDVGLFGVTSKYSSLDHHPGVHNLTIEGGSITGKDYVGPLAGRFVGQMANVTADLTVHGEKYVGGLIGRATAAQTTSNTDYDQKIENCSAYGDVYGIQYVGGLLGHGGTRLTILDSSASGNVTGIFDEEDHNHFGGFIGRISGQGGTSVSNSYATGDVNAPSADQVGGFVGELAYNSATNSYATGSVAGNEEVGGFVGKMATGSSCTESYATGNVDGYSRIGGFAGYSIRNLSGLYASGDVTGVHRVGGFVGQIGWVANFISNRRDLSNVNAHGNVEGSGSGIGGLAGWIAGDITNSYMTGSVSGDGSSVGSIVGTWDSGSSSNTYYNEDVNGQSGSGTPKTTEQMKQQATYVDWNFSSTWGINSSENQGYPFLRWQGYEHTSD
ncbi:hypothetical protein SYNTR_1724 [Candidatus Syntrophocurvum alkaliphilum]|uniref:SLH domain-containing protein n=2 Tax=Candidatus Syntrophocurvum alkaliphilum TaxID=2293317 RepID=A0A6I6DJX1_9FIRM|nr:hypothetical protein SYNTR_1724 [Candidatus Syntrophocurvum alkaliphilum]